MSGAPPRRVRLPLPGVDLGAEQGLPLPADAVHYLTVVRRLAPGDALVVFDGRGTEVEALLARRGETWMAEPVSAPRPGASGAALTVCCGLTKSVKLDATLRQLTELGVARVLPVLCARSVARPAPERAARRELRWARIAAEAARQCGRADVPDVASPLTFTEAIDATATSEFLGGLGATLVELIED